MLAGTARQGLSGWRASPEHQQELRSRRHRPLLPVNGFEMKRKTMNRRPKQAFVCRVYRMRGACLTRKLPTKEKTRHQALITLLRPLGCPVPEW
jgi:hypothetical protein